MVKQFVHITLFGILLFTGCKKETPDDPEHDGDFRNGVFIVNEGNFQWGNASLTFYSYDSLKSFSSVFEQTNNRPLGDVAYSLHLRDTLAFLVINNSGKIEVFHRYKLESIAQITALGSPRKMAFADDKAFVTELYGNKVHVLNINDFTKIDEVAVLGWTEDVIAKDGKVYCMVSTKPFSGDTVSALACIDVISNTLDTTFTLRAGIRSLTTLANGEVWALFKGDSAASEKPAIAKINVQTGEEEKTYEFTEYRSSPSSLIAVGDRLAYIDEGVFIVDPMVDIELPDQAIVDNLGNRFYSLSPGPDLNSFFVLDAKDYVQNGVVYQYSIAGALQHTIESQIIPTHAVYAGD